MDICICDITALEVYRSHGRLLPTLLEGSRTSKLSGCGLPPRQMLEDTMSRLGAKKKPYHLAFGTPNQAKSRQDIRRHTHTGTLPRRSLIRIDRETLIVSPELLFVELAARPDYDEVDLALLGYELCGTYVLDPDDTSWDGLISHGTSLTSKKRIAGALSRIGRRRGVARARRALSLFEDGSNSPMESVLALLFHLPRHLGGLGLGPISMNRKVVTPAGDRWVDVFFTAQRVGLEYKGVKAHSVEKAARDDRRQNKLTGLGVSILNVWYEDLTNDHLFAQLVRDVAGALGIRLRIRSRGFDQRQKLLRLRLMPAIERYGSFIA